MSTFTIGNRVIGDNHPCLIITELSANHNQKLEIDTIRQASKAGADAIKLQTYTPDSLTIDCKKDYFKIDDNTIWDGGYMYDLYQTAYMPWEWHEELKRVAIEEGLMFFSTPFSEEAVDFLCQLGVDVLKIASPEITHLPLIEYAAKKLPT